MRLEVATIRAASPGNAARDSFSNVPQARQVSMTSGRRPKSWHNWRELEAGRPSNFSAEHELHSDAEVHGLTSDFGPFRLMNPIAGPRRDETSRPVLVLRIDYHTSAAIQDEDLQYRGGTAEEVASLVSMCLAARMRAGDYTRVFKVGADPRGEPRANQPVNRPYLAHGSWTPIIARTARTVDLEELALVRTYPKLDAEQATALVRAARLYQDALWVSEREPALTWLFLV